VPSPGEHAVVIMPTSNAATTFGRPRFITANPDAAFIAAAYADGTLGDPEPEEST
jgi:hypothetical protein